LTYSEFLEYHQKASEALPKSVKSSTPASRPGSKPNLSQKSSLKQLNDLHSTTSLKSISIPVKEDVKKVSMMGEEESLAQVIKRAKSEAQEVIQIFALVMLSVETLLKCITYIFGGIEILPT
jgi:hypothetical protein